MRLDSFTVGYSLTEDRLLLQALGDGEPQSFWITRRAALMIAEGFQKVLVEQYQKFGGEKIHPGHVDDLLAFDQATATQQHPPKPGAVQETVTEPPILIYQIRYSAEDPESCVIHLTDATGRGHGYRLTPAMLHALLNLMQTQCVQAGWNITLVKPATLTSMAVSSLH